MRLAKASDVVALLGISENTGATATAEAALSATGEAVANKLGTTLKAATYADHFSYTIARYRRKFEPVVLRLTAGFVDVDSFIARRSTDNLPIAAVTDGEDIPTTEYILDAAGGTVTLLADMPVGVQTLLFSYDAGFSESAGVLKDTPEWLAQAGLLAAAKILQANPANMANRKVVAVREVQNAMLGEVSSVLNPHIRTRSGVRYPDRYTSE